MAQVSALIDALKAVLRGSGVKYADVGRALGLSESSVKRRFSRNDFSLEELDTVCALAGCEISDLVQTMERQRGQLQRLTAEQEAEIAADIALLLIAVCVLNHWRFEEILHYYTFDEHDLVRKLATLDRLKIIELQPGNRIKLLVATNFGWLSNGPIEKVFLRVIQNDFFSARFDREENELLVLNGMLSDASNAELRRKLKQLARDFDMLNREDTALPLEERHGNTVLLAVRDWHYKGFAPFRRDVIE